MKLKSMMLLIVLLGNLVSPAELKYPFIKTNINNNKYWCFERITAGKIARDLQEYEILKKLDKERITNITILTTIQTNILESKKIDNKNTNKEIIKYSIGSGIIGAAFGIIISLLALYNLRL